MQSHNSGSKCSQESNLDRGWNTAIATLRKEAGLDNPKIPDPDNRTVCLSATLRGEGKVSSL
jgi:hypothetical protein